MRNLTVAILCWALAVSGCSGGFSLGLGDDTTPAVPSPSELEAARTEAVYQFLRTETGDGRSARAIADTLVADRRTIAAQARAGEPALALATRVTDGRAIGNGPFALELAPGKVTWLFPARCHLAAIDLRASRGATAIVATGIGEQDVRGVTGTLEGRLALLLVEVDGGQTASLAAVPMSGPAVAILATAGAAITGTCQ